MECPRCYSDMSSVVCQRCGFPGPIEEKHDIIRDVRLRTYDKKFKKKILDTQYYKNCRISSMLFDLAACYKFGIKGLEKNEKEAEYWIERAIKMAEKSKTYNGEAQYDLAYRYEKGRLVPFDLEKAKYFYEMASELGHELSKQKLEYINKLIDYYPMAEKGDVKAQAYIAKYFKNLFYWAEYCYLNYPANKECYRFAKMAAEQGDNYSLYILGLCYGYGAGVERDLKKAFECFEKSAEQGNADAYLALAGLYERGYYVDENKDKSIEYYKKAFELGNRTAGHILSQIFCYDPQINDINMAIEILDMLEQNGFGLNSSVLLLVALSLSKDKNGKIRNIDMAKKWLDLASNIAEEIGADDIVKLNNYVKNGGDIEDYLQKNKLDIELLLPPQGDNPYDKFNDEEPCERNYEVHTEIRIDASEKDAIAMLTMLEKFEKKYEEIKNTVVEISDKKLSLDQFDYIDISKYATDENVNMLVFTDGPNMLVFDDGPGIDDSMFRILAASAPEASFSASTVANSDYSEERMECVLSNRKLEVTCSTVKNDADIDDYVYYLTECIPYDRFIETFKISSDSLPEEYYSNVFWNTDFDLASLYEQIIYILDEDEIDYEDPGEDTFSKMLDGVMDKFDFMEFGFDGTHKEKLFYKI